MLLFGALFFLLAVLAYFWSIVDSFLKPGKGVRKELYADGDDEDYIRNIVRDELIKNQPFKVIIVGNEKPQEVVVEKEPEPVKEEQPVVVEEPKPEPKPEPVKEVVKEQPKPHIGEYAFQNTAFTSLTLKANDNLEIGRGAFADCSRLKYVYLQEGIKSIGNCAFENCSIKAIVLPSSAAISESVFYGCNELESVTIPTIGFDLDTDYPNYYFGSLFGSDEPSEEASNPCVPASLKTVVVTGDGAVGYMAFANCNNIETIRFTGNPVCMASNIFSGCTSLKKVIVPYIGGGAVNGISGGTEELGLIYNIEIGGKPDDSVGNDNDLLVDTTNDKIFRKIDGKWYSQLQFVHIGESTPGDITYGHGAPTPASGNSFYVDVDNYDFYEIDNTDPNVWHKIGNLNILFAKFAYIFVSPNGNATFDTFNNDTLSNLKTVVITKGSYNQTYDRYFIREDSFMGCADIEHISLPKDVYTIDDNAFKGCTSLKTVTFENNSILESFGRDSFKGCSSLTSIVIPNGVVYIFDNSFMDCTLLKYVVFQDNSHVETIYKQAFANCTSLESIIIPSSVTELQIGCFQGCSSLKSITVPFVGSNATSNAYAYLGHIFGAQKA